jgi:hypothetical protein
MQAATNYIPGIALVGVEVSSIEHRGGHDSGRRRAKMPVKFLRAYSGASLTHFL